MKKIALVLAIAATLAACGKDETPKAAKKAAAPAPVQQVQNFPSVYEQEATKAAATAFEATVKSLSHGDADPRKMREAEVTKEEVEAFKAHEAARRELMTKLTDPAARGAASREVMKKALATPQERRAYHMNLRRLRDAARPGPNEGAANPAAPAKAARPVVKQ